MPPEMIRAAIVGASTLLGKDLADELNSSVNVLWDLKLLDEETAAGQITSAADEALLIQPLTVDSFSKTDVVFFAGTANSTREFWQNAVTAGAAVVDLTHALDGEQGVTVRAPLVTSADQVKALNLNSVAVISAHPASVLLGSIVSAIQARFKPFQASATILEPASQMGSAGVDELHEQTVSLLSFKALSQEVFDAQVAYNLLADLGVDAKANLQSVGQAVRADLVTIAGSAISRATSIQLIQSPVFNGYTASVFVITPSPVKATEVERALAGALVSVAGPDDPSPSNQAAAQQNTIQVRVRSSEGKADEPNGFWLWLAADNIRLTTRNAIACAAELLALRPNARIQ